MVKSGGEHIEVAKTAKQDRAQFTGMWKDAYLQDRRLFYSIPKTPPLTKQTNETNCMPFPCPKLTKTNEQTKQTVCLSPATNSPLSAITSFERGNKAGFMDTVRQVAEAISGSRCQDNNCTDTIEAKLRDNSAPTRPATRQKRDTLVFDTNYAWRTTRAPGPERTYHAGQFSL